MSFMATLLALLAQLIEWNLPLSLIVFFLEVRLLCCWYREKLSSGLCSDTPRVQCINCIPIESERPLFSQSLCRTS